MRNWKNWLFPILTCLTVTALALLPLRLSTLRDGELAETVHTEELSADSNFPFKPPDLPGRIWLLVQWEELPDNLTIMSQELEGAERDREFQRLQEALTGLVGVLPQRTVDLLLGLDGNSWDCERYYLRDQRDLSSASFTRIATYDKLAGMALAATLDGESGQLVNLQTSGAKDILFDSPPLETGKALLERLNLSYEAADGFSEGDTSGSAFFRLPESGSVFHVNQYERGLFFGFQMDWEAVDAAAAEAYGYSTDANSMQNW